MSTYRDSLTPETRERFDRAIAGFAAVYYEACLHREELAAVGGSRAVAEAAWHRGHRLSVDEIQEQYEAMAAQHREKAA